MAKKAKTRAGARAAGVGLLSLLGAGRANPFAAIASPQSNYNPMRPTPMVVPKGKRKEPRK